MIKSVYYIMLIFFACGCSSPIRFNGISNKKPIYENTNVILISIDTLRNDHLGCYGYRRNTSPNIDQLARHSVVFENFITQANLTPISQMSIFTSQYPRMNGMINFETTKDEVESRKLPEILKYYDYFNAAFLSSSEFYLNLKLVESGAMLPGRSIFSENFDLFEPAKQSTKIPEEAIKWLRDNANKRFFMWIPIGSVHWPYAWAVPEPLRAMFDPKGYSPFFLNYEGSTKMHKDYLSIDLLSRIYKGDYYFNFSPVHHLTEQDKEFIISRYDAGIYYTDMFIGRLLSELEKCRLTDKTMIIVHSIHGEDLGEHGYFQHYDIYDTEVKNALIIKFPKNKFRGKRIIKQVQGIDIVPTLLDYLNIPVSHEFQGQSLMPLIKKGQFSKSDEFAYITRIPLWEFMLSRFLLELSKQYKKDYYLKEIEEKSIYRALLRDRFGVYPEYRYPPYDIGIRTNKWKLILRKNTSLLEEISWWGFISGKKITHPEIELYDLENDPFEQRNVVTAYPDIAKKLKEKVLQQDSDIEKKRPKGALNNPDRSIIPYP